MGSLESSVASLINGIETNRGINTKAHDSLGTKMDSLEEQMGHLHICMETRVGRLERNWKLLVTAASAMGAFVASGITLFKDRFIGWFA